MDPSRQRWLARLLLAAGVLGAIAWVARLDFARKVSTDLLDLIPRDERMPELTLARSLATAEHARVAFFVLAAPDDSRREAAARAFVDSLRGSPAFAEALLFGDTAARDAFGRHVYDHRLDLLAPDWLARQHAAWIAAGRPGTWPAWLAEGTAANLELFLTRPEAMPFQDLLPGDPLLLVPELAIPLQGLTTPGSDTPGETLVWARTRDDPLQESAQQAVLDAVQDALAAAHAIEPAVHLQWAAISRFAAENRRRIRNEVETLNVVSLLAVLGIAFAGLRRIRSVVHLAPVLGCALLAAWVGATLAFDRVHVLVFVLGSLLGGVAIDYGFYLQLQPPLHAGESYPAKVRRLLRPLLSSSLTTVLGFLLLVTSDLPLIRQLGVFISAGLLGALAAALLWFGQLGTAVAGARDFMLRPVPGREGSLVWLRRLVLGAGAFVALVGPWHVHWRDDVRDLEALPQAMRDEAAAVRTRFGNTLDRSITITRGDTPAEARTALARFLQTHAARHPTSPAASVGQVLPEPAAWATLAERVGELDGFIPALRTALERHGFEAEEFAPFYDAWSTWTAAPRPEYEALVAEFRSVLRGPMALTLSVAPGASWFMAVADHPPEGDTGDPATISLDRLQSLNDLFLRHRQSALLLSCIGLGLVGVSVLWIYGLRAGWRIFLLPVSASLFAFGVFGLVGQPLNLFHLLGAFLGVCLSHNYAIFTAENAQWSAQPAPSVRLSAVTTAASFGVLALSRIPVVSALGTTVALVVAAALVMVELAPPAARLPARRSGS